MKYTVRYAHLKAVPDFYIGDKIMPGEPLAIMGSSGKSSADHLHIDCVVGSIIEPWTLADMENLSIHPAFRQLCYFIDADLFKTELVITSHFNDPQYLKSQKKVHLAFDVVPGNRKETKSHYTICWNRSIPGTVLTKGWHTGYGNYLHVEFER